MKRDRFQSNNSMKDERIADREQRTKKGGLARCSLFAIHAKGKSRGPQAGFTLIEMVVAVALFSIVMLVAGATLLSLVYANRKAQALQSVINNLNVSLDGMVRNIREGSNYNCRTATHGDCSGGGTIIYFTPYGGGSDWAYALCTNTGSGWDIVTSEQSGQVYSLCENLNSGWVPITSPEVEIQDLTFYVTGTKPASQGGTQQPEVVFTMKGQAGKQATSISTFDIQATAVQRQLNL